MGNLSLRGGTVVTASRTFCGDVEIRDERIVAIVERDQGDRAIHINCRDQDVRVLDVTGKYVLPGIIDVHVHFRDPGATHKEDFLTGTMAAAAGGVTTVLDMPNTLPPVSSAPILEQKAAAIQGRSHVDYGLYGVINEHNLNDLVGMAHAGAIAFKLFLGPTTGDIRAPGWGRLIDVFEAVREIGLPLVVHAEDRDVITYWERRVPDRDGASQDAAADTTVVNDYGQFLETRPRFGEAAATQTICLLAAMTGTPVHIAHVSIAEAVAVIRQAKANGAPITAETCPTYLTMTAADCERLGTMSKILPPVREKSDQEELWRALGDCTVDIIATDHAPHESEVKNDHSWITAAGGMVGVQTMLPVLLTEVEHGRLSLNDVVRLTSQRPAELFGLAHRKGDVRVGLDADLVVLDLSSETTITADRLHSRSKNSPLLGSTLRGAVLHTILRGRMIVENGSFMGEPSGQRLGPS